MTDLNPVDAMTTDFRALCTELSGLDGHCVVDCTEEWADAMCRLRAALAEPVAKRPTVMEIIELHSWLEDEWRANNDGEDLPTVDFARAVLAKWGRQ